MKKHTSLLLLCLVIVMMTGCGGPSKEKIEEVQSIYESLVNKHNEVIEVYAGIDDDEFTQKLNDMTEEIKSIGQQDVKDMTNGEIDVIIQDIQSNLAAYDDILSSIEQITAKETAVETAMRAIPVTLQNNTGVKLYQLYLYKASESSKGDNLVEDIGYLEEYQMRNILNLYMAEDEMLWHLEAIDEDGNIIESADIDFSGCSEDGVTVRMEYSFDTMEGWIELE